MQRAAVTDPLLSTRDRDEAQAYVTDVYIPHDLQAHDRAPLDFNLRHMASERLTIGHLTYGADSELIVPPMESCYHVNLTLHGETQVKQRGRLAATEAYAGGVAIAPTDPFTVRWSPSAVQYAIKLPRRPLETQLSKLVRRPVERPIRFDLGFDLTSPAGATLLSAVTFLAGELARSDGVATRPLLRDQLESYVLSALLHAVPNDFSDQLAAPGRPVRRSNIQRVIDHIHDDPAQDLSISALADLAGITARSLQTGFQDVVGTSPSRYVRAVRLDRAHEDILASGGAHSISDIAMRWGFFHLSRFSKQYRERFGVLPSETARQIGQEAGEATVA